MSLDKSFLLDALIVLALLLVGAAGYYYSPLLLPKSDVTATADPACDLHARTCGATLPGGGRVELGLAPKPIPNLKPIDVEVGVAGISPSKVTLDLAGATMNMGINRTDLTQAAPGRYTGTTSLPVCVTGSMAWVATVIVESGRERISVPFQFSSSSH